jgi:hypothetical protein
MSDSMPHNDKKQHKPLSIVITTFEADDTVYREKALELTQPGNLTWLIRHIVWACHNGKTVEIAHKDNSEAS